MTARKNKKKGNKKRTKFWYVQFWGTYDHQTPVFVGYTEKEALAIMKARVKAGKMGKDPVAAFEKNMEEDEELHKTTAGFVWHSDDYAYTALFLTTFKDEWPSYETLMHECTHLALNVIAAGYSFIDFHSGEKKKIEHEGIAYQHEYLFRSIRRRLQKAFGYDKKP